MSNLNLVELDANELAEAFCDSNTLKDLESAKLLVSYYSCIGYEGNAFVLYEKDGELYEVNGSHCSCYGLEGQWEPTLTTWKALAMREFSCCGNTKLIKQLISSHLES
jgi:hypothetical protein